MKAKRQKDVRKIRIYKNAEKKMIMQGKEAVIKEIKKEERWEGKEVKK